MERLTFDGLFCDICMCDAELDYCGGECATRKHWDRLKSIEDILGPNYDLSRIKELVEADRDGRISRSLQKQKKENVIYSGDGYDPDGNMVYDMAECPRCGHDFDYGDECWECRYCPDCGQALAWSEEQSEEAEKALEDMNG